MPFGRGHVVGVGLWWQTTLTRHNQKHGVCCTALGAAGYCDYLCHPGFQEKGFYSIFWVVGCGVGEMGPVRFGMELVGPAAQGVATGSQEGLGCLRPVGRIVGGKVWGTNVRRQSSVTDAKRLDGWGPRLGLAILERLV